MCDVLLAVATRGAYANLLLPSVLRDRQLSGRDAALATELCYGTLRGQGSYDAILTACSDRPVGQMDPPVREVLRLGVHQLLGTRIAAHAAVATSVDLAKDVAGSRSAGFVNAVLRRVSTRDLEAWVATVAPAAAPTRPGTWRSGTATRAGSSPRCARPSATARTAPRRDRGPLAAGNVPPRVTLCALPGRSEPGELAGGRLRARPLRPRSAPTWPRATRRRLPAVASAGPPCRTRPASWPRSPSAGPR